MFDEIRDFLEYLSRLLFFFVLILALFFLCLLGISQTSWWKEHVRVEAEWQQKVNNCVLDENYRKDCKLILYRDTQIHNQQAQDNQQASVMTGAMVGGMVGASMGRK